MKLLFDNNLSHKLPMALADIFPDSIHVREVGLASAEDEAVWAFAKANGLAIVTKDDDFRQMSLTRGAPPKVVQIELGNCTTQRIETLIRWRTHEMLAFDADPGQWLLSLS